MLASTVFKKIKGTGSAYNKALKTTPFGRSDAFTRGGFAIMPHATAPLSLMLCIRSSHGANASVKRATQPVFAVKDGRPESLLWGIAGLFSLYLFISDYIGESEVTILIKNISSFKTYSILTYISVALSGFLLTFDATLLFTFVVIFPVIINAFMVRPFVFVNLYKKNYTRLFGVIDA